MRRLVRQIHLITTLLAGWILAVTGLAGSVLVFRAEIDGLLQRDLRIVMPAEDAAAIDDIVGTVRRAFPDDAIAFIFPPRTERDAAVVELKRDQRLVFVDPYSARVLGTLVPGDTFTGYVRDLHVNLLTGAIGHTVVGLLGGVLLLLGATGAVLWWPGVRHLRRGFVPELRRGWKRSNYDLHKVAGIVALPLMCLSAITGVTLVFSTLATDLARRVHDQTPAPAVVASEQGDPLPLGRLLAAADAAMPEGHTTRISLPAEPGGIVVVRKKLPAESHPNGMSFLRIDGRTGEVLRFDDARTAAGAFRLLNARYPLHIGAWGGWPIRTIMCLAGLAPGALFISGLTIWWRRTRGRRKNRDEG